MNRAAVLVPFALVLTLFPLAEAKTDESRVRFESVSKIVAEGDLYFEGPDASELRRVIDENGNTDGHASASEVNNFEIDYKDFVEDDFEAGFINTINLDGEPPSSWTLDLLDLLDATGSIDDEGLATMKIQMTLNFDVMAGQSHTYFVDMEADPEADPNSFTTETITAPPGYTIDSTSGFPGNLHVAEDKRSLTYTESDTYDTDQRVVFVRAPAMSGGDQPDGSDEEEGGKGSPGISLVLVLGVLMALTARLRRP